MRADSVIIETVEVVIEFPDLKPDDVTLLDGLIEDRLESEWSIEQSQVPALQDLRDRIARMLISACDKL